MIVPRLVAATPTVADARVVVFAGVAAVAPPPPPQAATDRTASGMTATLARNAIVLRVIAFSPTMVGSACSIASIIARSPGHGIGEMTGRLREVRCGARRRSRQLARRLARAPAGKGAAR